MDLLEVSALVSMLHRDSPCFGCCLQHLHVRGVSKMIFANCGLNFLLVVNRQMAWGFPKLGCREVFGEISCLSPFGEGCGRTGFHQSGWSSLRPSPQWMSMRRGCNNWRRRNSGTSGPEQLLAASNIHGKNVIHQKVQSVDVAGIGTKVLERENVDDRKLECFQFDKPSP